LNEPESLYRLLGTAVYAKRVGAGVACTDFCLMQGAVALSRIKMLPLQFLRSHCVIPLKFPLRQPHFHDGIRRLLL